MFALFCQNDISGLGKYLQQHPNEVEQSLSGSSLLFHAVRARNYQICSLLLTYGANTNSKQHWSNLTPTHYAVMAFVLDPCKETKNICLQMLRDTRLDEHSYNFAINGLHHISEPIKSAAQNLTTVYELQQHSYKYPRSGQHVLRQKLLKEFNQTCPVSGSTDTDLLDAAHIVPYAQCNNCFVFNACLFHKSFHCAMDLGKMRFDSTGQLHCLQSIHDEELQRSYNVYHSQLPCKYLTKARTNCLEITFKEWETNKSTRPVHMDVGGKNQRNSVGYH